MKKKFLLLLTAILSICVFAFTLFACGNEPVGALEYEPYDYGTEYQVVGLGTVKSKTVSVPDTYKGKPVTRIAEGAFSESNIEKVVLPEGIEEIADSAFSDCPLLTNVVIPQSVYTVAANAFSGSVNLNYTVSNQLKYLGNGENSYLLLTGATVNSLTELSVNGQTKLILAGAFMDFDFLKSVNISDGVERIGSQAFDGCDNLNTVTLGANVKKIDSRAFYNCNALVEVFNKSSLNVKKKSIENGYVGYNALAIYTGNEQSKISTDGNGFVIFENNTEKILVGYSGTQQTIEIPTGITSVNNRAFYGNQSLTSAILPSGLKSIGMQAFYGCENLSEITLPSSIEKIGDYAFYGCGGLSRVSLGDSLIEIGNYAFSGCENLSEITLPSTLTKLGNAPFKDCKNLVSFTANGDSAGFKAIDGNLYTFDGKTLVQYALGKTAAEFTLPSGVEVVSASAFEGETDLTCVTFGAALKGVDASAFYGCTALQTVDFGLSVALASVGSSAFYGCASLIEIAFPETLVSLGSSAFYGCTSLISVEVGAPQLIDAYTFYGCKSLRSIRIPNSVKGINAYAFYGCEDLVNVTINSDSPLTGFGEYSFADCKSLTSIVIPPKTENIQKFAFKGCESLATVDFIRETNWWTWDKGNAEVGSSIGVVDDVLNAQNLTGFYCKHLWRCNLNG